MGSLKKKIYFVKVPSVPCDFNFTKKYLSSGQVAISGELESLTAVSGEKCLGGQYAISGMMCFDFICHFRYDEI